MTDADEVVEDIRVAIDGAKCRGCGKPLLDSNRWNADGCSCNSHRGVNHGLVPGNICTCKECDPAQTGCSRFEDGSLVAGSRRLLVSQKLA